MGTRSRIAVLQTDGSVKSIYCHWDGYYSHNGRLLLQYYNTEEKANELIALGDLSSLGENINPTGTHSFDNPQDNVTVAYHRDRGEDFNVKININETNFYKRGGLEEYNYIFKEGKWFTQKTKDKWVMLTEEIIIES